MLDDERKVVVLVSIKLLFWFLVMTFIFFLRRSEKSLSCYWEVNFCENGFFIVKVVRTRPSPNKLLVLYWAFLLFFIEHVEGVFL